MTQKDSKPSSDLMLAIQTIALPAETNQNGDIFGGWLLSQMDLAGGVMANERSLGRFTTVAIDSMVFKKPVHVGDTVSCYTRILKIGTTSVKILIEAWCRRACTGRLEQVTEGIFTYVAIDEEGKPRPIPSEEMPLQCV